MKKQNVWNVYKNSQHLKSMTTINYFVLLSEYDRQELLSDELSKKLSDYYDNIHSGLYSTNVMRLISNVCDKNISSNNKFLSNINRLERCCDKCLTKIEFFQIVIKLLKRKNEALQADIKCIEEAINVSFRIIYPATRGEYSPFMNAILQPFSS